MHRLVFALCVLALAACASTSEERALPDDFSLSSPAYSMAEAERADASTAAILARPAPQGCEDEFQAAVQPVFRTEPSAADLTAICFHHFAVLYSGRMRGPIWSAYRLTRSMSEEGDAYSGERPSYHDEQRVPSAHRSHASDYAHNPYDVGHMTPNNDMPEAISQRESFSMSNMSPQYETLNRRSWKDVEAIVHKLAQTSGELFIVTGPIFNAHPALMNGRVAIPAAFFKAVYDVQRNSAIAFVFDNKDGAACELLSISDLEARAGLAPFPLLSARVKTVSGQWAVPEVCKH